MSETLLFNTHVDTLLSDETENKDIYLIETMLPNVMSSNAKYIGGMLLTVNTNFDKFTTFLQLVNDSEIVDASQKFFLLKKLLFLSSRLTLQKRHILTKTIWSYSKFRESFKYFLMLMKATSKEEKHNGPFCSLFPNMWTNDFQIYMAALEPLLKDKDNIQYVLSYIDKFIDMNRYYMEGNPAEIDSNCSTIDFNCNIIYIMLEIKKMMNNGVYGGTLENCEDILHKAINIMYVPITQIKSMVYNQLNQVKGTKFETQVKLSIDRVLAIYADPVINGYIKDNLARVVAEMETTKELDNMCMYMMEKFSSDYSNAGLKDALTSMSEMIIDNKMGSDMVSAFLDLSLKRAKVEMKSDDVKQIINNILLEFNNGYDDIVNNINAFINLLSLYTEYGDLTVDNNQTLYKMLRKMKALIPKDPDPFLAAYKISALKYYTEIGEACIKATKTEGSWLQPVRRVLNNTVNMYILLQDSSDKIEAADKKMITDKLVDCVKLAELDKKDIAVLKVKLAVHMTPELSKAIDDTLPKEYRDGYTTRDFVFREKKIVNPIFVKLEDNEIIIDATTLITPEFNTLIDGKTTIAAINAYNRTPEVLLKKIELMGILNVYDS